MYQTATTWDLTGSDGTVVTFAPDGTSAFVIQDVTGFDSPNVRENVEDLPEADGAVAGDFYFGSRPVTFSGVINATSSSARNQAVVGLQRALRGLRGDITILSHPDGLPAMRAKGRLQNVRVTGGFTKNFQIGIVCADPLIYSQTLNARTATGAASTTGATFPWTFPVSFGAGSGALLTVSVTNAGNFNSPPVLRVYGPVVNPAIKNLTTLEDLTFANLTLGAGEWVEVDMNLRTAVKNDATNQYSRILFPGSEWFGLIPGSNTLELRAASGGTTQLDVSWYDVWA